MEIHIVETISTGKFLNNNPDAPIVQMGTKTLCGRNVRQVRTTGEPTCPACLAKQAIV